MPETTEGLEYPFHKEVSVAAAAFHGSFDFISSPFVVAPGSVTFSSRGRALDQITIEHLLFWQMKHKDPLSSMLLKAFLSLAYIHMAQKNPRECLRARSSMYSN